VEASSPTFFDPLTKVIGAHADPLKTNTACFVNPVNLH